MFITNGKVSESLQFLVICREVLSLLVDASSLDKQQKELTKNFIFNEASDYQIISMIVRNELPENKFDTLDELKVFSELREQVINSPIIEKLDTGFIANFLCEVNSVYPFYSSAKPVLEFITESHDIPAGSMIISEAPLTPTDVTTWARKIAKAAGATPEAVASTLRRAAAKGADAKDAIAAASKAAAQKSKIGWGQFLKKTDPSLQRMIAQKGGVGTGGQGSLSASQAASIKGAMRGPQSGAEKVAAAGKRLAGKGQEALTGLMNKIKASYPDAVSAARAAVEKSKEFAQTPGGQAIGAAALLALIAYGAYKLYKSKLSAAAKACAGKKGAEKAACMAQAKKAAIGSQIANMKKAEAMCARTKNPAKCKAGVNAKIAKLQKKASKIK
jgi:hypothetical protein